MIEFFIWCLSIWCSCQENNYFPDANGKLASHFCSLPFSLSSFFLSKIMILCQRYSSCLVRKSRYWSGKLRLIPDLLSGKSGKLGSQPGLQSPSYFLWSLIIALNVFQIHFLLTPLLALHCSDPYHVSPGLLNCPPPGLLVYPSTPSNLSSNLLSLSVKHGIVYIDPCLKYCCHSSLLRVKGP